MRMYEAAKDVAKILKESGKIDEYQKILELLEKLLEMQKKIADLEKKNQELKESFKVKKKLEYKNNSYWNGEEGPYCSRCWEKNKDLMRMHHEISHNYAHCPECKTSVNFTGKSNGLHKRQVFTIKPESFS